MSWVSGITKPITSLMAFKHQPKFSLEDQLSKHVASEPVLTRVHNPKKGPKFLPKMVTLPLRTMPTEQIDLNKMAQAQNHAFYEEIDTIPAKNANAKSPFGHWYIIHPLSPKQVKALNTEVLVELKKWIEEKDIYVGKHPQLEAFNDARKETLKLVSEALWKKEIAEVGKEARPVGTWDEVEEDWSHLTV